MNIVDSRYKKLYPKISLLQDEVVLAQAWKKTHTFIRQHNWYADVLELDVSAVCLLKHLSEWSRSISSGNYRTAPAWLVPAPKNGLWCFRDIDEGGWCPRLSQGENEPVLRPLAHIGIREQTVATAVMLCLADSIESLQGNTSLKPAEASAAGMFSYGNRLFCNWLPNNSQATFSWGNSNTYSRYFQDYQRFVARPIALATEAEAEDEDARVFIASLDISAFFDNIDIDLLVERMRTEYENYTETTEGGLRTSDETFWKTARNALKFQWREEDEELADLFRGGVLPSGLPQGLVSSGFFANAYLIPFDRAVGAFIGRRPPKKKFRVHDYCRYVDDLRLVVSVDMHEEDFVDPARLAKEISVWVQTLLEKHTSPAGKPEAHLQINESKTQLEPLASVGSESATATRMKALQQQLSGPFDMESLLQAEAGLNGLLSLAELSLIEDSESPQLPDALRLSSMAKLKLEVRDDTLTRFSAYRLVRSLRMRRSMTDLTDVNNGDDAKDGLAHDFQAAARRLVAAWAVNPSLVQVLKYALDLYPSKDLLEPIEQALMSKLIGPPSPNDFGRRVSFYVLADLFKAGATETGKQAEHDPTFKVADVEGYRLALAKLAKRVSRIKDVPWYVQQQSSLLLASLNMRAGLPSNAPELRLHRILHAFLQGRTLSEQIPAEEEVVVSLVGHQLLGSVTHYEKWFIRFCDDLSRLNVSQAWRVISDTSPDLLEKLFKSRRAEIVRLVLLAPRYLIRYTSAKWAEGIEPLPVSKWLPLITAITHPAGLFKQENSLLGLALAISRSSSIQELEPQLLTPLNVQIKSNDWSQVSIPKSAHIEVRAVGAMKATDRTYETPSWCRAEDAWMYAFGRLLRAAATGEPDFTARHWLAREDSGWYWGLRSTWHKRRMGMLHTAEGVCGTTGAITPWFSDLLLQLLRWPGIMEHDSPQSVKIRTRRDFKKVVEKRFSEQARIFGDSSNLPIYRYPFDWPLDSTRGLRVAMVQGLMPLHAHFEGGLDGLEEQGYREKHRNHTAALLHLASKHLAARDYVLGTSQKPHFDLVVFPELSIHVDDQDLMRAFSDATGAMLFYGLLAAKEPGTDEPINAARWLIPQKRGGRRSWVQVDQGKFHLTPEEKDLGIKSWRPYQVVIELFDASRVIKPYRLSGSICFDATDIALAADLKDESHMYVVSAMNKDVKTFDSMVAALRYHMYQHVLVANIGEYGGSTAQAPYDKEHRRLISHSHGNEQLAISVFDVRMEDFGPEMEAAVLGTPKSRKVSERIGKAPPAGLKRDRNYSE